MLKKFARNFENVKKILNKFKSCEKSLQKISAKFRIHFGEIKWNFCKHINYEKISVKLWKKFEEILTEQV